MSKQFLPMKIRALIEEMSAAAIEEAIPEQTLKDIRRTDTHPLFRAYTVAHEGQSRGKIIGVGNVVKKWAAEVIRKLHDKIAVGLEMFLGHGRSNEVDPSRTVVGRVVAKRLLEIAGRTSSVVIAYIDPKFSAMPLDVCSIEAGVDLEVDRNGVMIANEVGSVSGIALGNSSVDTPGFSFATIQGALQAFAVEHGLTGPVEVAPEGEVLNKYLDPRFNKFIRLSAEDYIPEKDDAIPTDLYTDPKRNPFIKTGE